MACSLLDEKNPYPSPGIKDFPCAMSRMTLYFVLMAYLCSASCVPRYSIVFTCIAGHFDTKFYLSAQ